ncbi:MAG: transporter substrate-binding domain-containing protein [Clostridia bacterium]|nr:transporter substrate-binding domain-containing protein [Clostridia bacterium]
MKKIIAVLLTLVLAVGLFAACSNTGTETTTDGAEDTTAAKTELLKVIDIALTSEEYAFAVTKGDTELLNSLNSFLADIKENGKFDEIMNKYFGDGTPEGVLVSDATVGASDNQLVIATNAAFAPFEYVEGEYYYGVDIEIMNLFAQSLGKTLAVNDMEFDSVCTAVGEDMCDIAASGLTVNDERKEILDFSTSYYNASQKIIAAADDTAFDACETAEDAEAVIKALAEGTKIGYQTGTTGAFYIDGDADWGFDGFANIVGTGYSNGAFAVQDILNGNIAYVVIDEAPAANIVAGVNG